MDTSRTFLTLLLLAVAHSAVAASSCPDASGARSAKLLDTDAQQSLASQLAASWDTDDPGRVIRFGGYVGVDGQLRDVCCITSSIFVKPAAEVSLVNRVAGLRFEPANLNGEDIKVFVGFAIIAKRTDSGIQSTLLMNNLISMEQHGARYIAPQRISVGALWAAGGIRIDGSIWGEVTVDVDATGTASNARISRWERGHARRKSRFASKMQAQCFIPGKADGVVAAMSYSEVFQQ